MDLRGQYYKFTIFQKMDLRSWALAKRWKKYWVMKKIYILEYEERQRREQSQSQTASTRYSLELEKMKKEQTQS